MKQLNLCRSKLIEAKKTTEDAARRFQTSENQAISTQMADECVKFYNRTRIADTDSHQHKPS